MMAIGMDWLTTKLQTHASKPVYYKRGASTIAVCAIPGRTMLKLSDEYGATRVEWTDKDWLIPTADLVIGGSPTLPKRGDQVLEPDGVSMHTFEVLPYGDEPPWRWCDPYRKMLRVHFKRITTEPVS